MFRVADRRLTLHLPVQGEYVVASALDGYIADPGTAAADAADARELRCRVLDPDAPLIPFGVREAELLADAFDHAMAAKPAPAARE